MADLLPVTVDDMIGEVRRELDMRARLYPEWSRSGRANKRRLDRQYDVMEAVLAFLEGYKAGEQSSRDD